VQCRGQCTSERGGGTSNRARASEACDELPNFAGSGLSGLKNAVADHRVALFVGQGRPIGCLRLIGESSPELEERDRQQLQPTK
jgi:hypothetical protein